MDYGFSEEQELLRKTARDFLKAECPKTLVREVMTDEKGYSPELWTKMAGLGWMGAIFPEKYGGMGLTFLDLVVVLEEMGRVPVSSPFLATMVLGGLPILIAGTEAQKAHFLTEVSKGKRILTSAFADPDFRSWPASGIIQASREGDSFVLKGEQTLVPWAHVADWIVCQCNMARLGQSEASILLLVDARSTGLTCSVMPTMTAERRCQLTFNSVRVPKENILEGPEGTAEIVRKTLEQATVAECALMIGGAQQVLEMSTDYAKTRVQFDRAIGSFQAVRHRTSNQKIDCDGARYITYQAAWRISEGLPCALEASMAKAWTNQAFVRVCNDAHQTFAGIGITSDHDLGLYSRFSKAAEFSFGNSDYHIQKLAQELSL